MHSELFELMDVLADIQTRAQRGEATRELFLERLRVIMGANSLTWAEWSSSANGEMTSFTESTDNGPTHSEASVSALRASTPATGMPQASPDGKSLVVMFQARGSTHLMTMSSEQPPSPMAHTLLRLIASHSWLLGRTLVQEGTRLPRRLGQTLELLLQGASEKRIAAALQLSSHTVHGYVKELYRRFDVSSRSELISSFLSVEPCSGLMQQNSATSSQQVPAQSMPVSRYDAPPRSSPPHPQ